MKGWLIVATLHILLITVILGQNPKGIWENTSKHGKPTSHIEVYEENGLLHGQVIRLLPDAEVMTCDRCEGALKGKHLEGMIILKNLKKTSDNLWEEGTILDPKKGKTYKCQVSLESPDMIKIRAFIGKPIFGKSLYWKKVD